MSDHGHRTEDIGFGRILKFWPVLVAIFTAGAWYQNVLSTREVMGAMRKQTDEHEVRIVRVEDAVIYLKDLVQARRRDRD